MITSGTKWYPRVISHLNESICVGRMVNKCMLTTVKLQTGLGRKFIECKSGKYYFTSFLLWVIVTHKSESMYFEGRSNAGSGRSSLRPDNLDKKFLSTQLNLT